MTDLPTTFVTITSAGRTKRVEDYSGAPRGLAELDRQIDDAARTGAGFDWTDRRCGRWSVMAGRRRARSAPSCYARRSSTTASMVTGLLEIGADPNGAYYSTNTPPLMMVRSAAAVRALIEPGAVSAARNDNGGTPLGWALYLAPDVTAVLLQAGGQAACRGNAGVVKLLLDAGASPSRHVGATSALDCARQGKDNARLRRPPVLDSKPPFVADFNGMIALLERALARRKQGNGRLV